MYNSFLVSCKPRKKEKKKGKRWGWGKAAIWAASYVYVLFPAGRGCGKHAAIKSLCPFLSWTTAEGLCNKCDITSALICFYLNSFQMIKQKPLLSTREDPQYMKACWRFFLQLNGMQFSGELRESSTQFWHRSYIFLDSFITSSLFRSSSAIMRLCNIT